jgi:bifunctional UDP-N-acetylglucosamine pyrophosphorylase/glucosamine-1-phosphate N-acetyltransferase
MKPAKGGNLYGVILAAGMGTRMKSSLPKVLHKVHGRPMLFYSLDAVRSLRPRKTVIVVGRNNALVRESVVGPGDVVFAVQNEQKGTAHALLSAGKELKGLKGTVLVTNGDTPLLTHGTLRKFLGLHRRSRNTLSVLSFNAKDPSSYGRILRGRSGSPLRVVEERDASKSEKAITEVNSGVYAMDAAALPLLKSIKINRKKGEYYLTDLLEAAAGKGHRVGVYCLGDEKEFLGVNSRKDLHRAHQVIRGKIIEGWLEKGVTFLDTSSVFIDALVKIGIDTVIYPNVCLEGSTRIGKNCTIYPNVRITDSTLRDGVIIKDSTLIENSTIGAGAQVGPFARLRPECRIGDSAKIGNFVELKKSSVGRGSKAMHLSYIGDSTLGRGVNIGAGTITCNYDGLKKYRTTIGNGVFVGSDTQFIAPVKVGKGAYIGAGSTITRNVPPDSLAIGRAQQVNVKGWAKRRKA